MGVASGCGEQEVGVASGSGWRFPHTTYPYSSCICTFLQQHLYFFVHFVNVFTFFIYIYREDFAQQYGKCGTRLQLQLQKCITIDADAIVIDYCMALIMCTHTF